MLSCYNIFHVLLLLCLLPTPDIWRDNCSFLTFEIIFYQVCFQMNCLRLVVLNHVSCSFQTDVNLLSVLLCFLTP